MDGQRGVLYADDAEYCTVSERPAAKLTCYHKDIFLLAVDRAKVKSTLYFALAEGSMPIEDMQ